MGSGPRSRTSLHWTKPVGRACSTGSCPMRKWFVGGELNVSVNCVDRHAASARKNKAAIIFEGEPGDSRILTYGQLYREVCKAANALTALGVKAGDFVAIYMGMVPEAAIAMLACARLGAPHTIVFGGFSAEALARSDQGLQGEVRADRRTAGGGAARSFRSRTTSTRRSWAARSRRWWSSSAAATRCSGRARTCGGTTSSIRRSRTTSRAASIASIHCSRSTRAARRVSRRASCTRPAAT